ncbi:MAG: response regulator, partial [Magnetococcales bacterium]|nr:response regulator [Magnetococcales bacterium]
LFEDVITDETNRLISFESTYQRIQEKISLLEGLVKGAEVDLLSRFKNKWLKYAETSDKILQFVQEGKQDKSKILYRKSGRTQHEIALRGIHQFIKKNEFELNNARKLLQIAIEKAQLGNRIIRNLSKIHRAEKDLILTLSPVEMQRYSARISLLRNNLKKQLDKLDTLATESEGEILIKIRKLTDEFFSVNQVIVEKSKENANRRAFDLSSGIARQFLDKSELALQKLVQKNDRDMQSALVQADRDFFINQNIGIGNAVFAILSCLLIAFLTIRFLAFRVKGLVARTNAISVGEVTVESYLGPFDELSEMDNALTNIASSYGNIANMAMQVVDGDFSGRLELRSEQDQLSKAINQIISNMEAIIHQAHLISQGEFDIVITPSSEKDRLSHALKKMANVLSMVDSENQQKRWEQDILLELGQAMQGKLSITALSNSVVEVLCRRLEAISGLLYMIVKLHDGEALQLTGSIAFSSKVNTQEAFKIGEGVVGQAILNHEPTVIKGLADSFSPISSGLGNIHPDTMVLAPFYFEGVGKGVVELLFLHPPEEKKIKFLGKVMKTIAMTFETVQARPLAEALNESRKLAAKLQETNKMLTDQSKDLEKARQVLEERNITLQQAQNELTAQAEKLKQSDRYKTDFLATMSHEIRTPMNGILGTAQILEKTSTTPWQQKLINTITKSGHSLLTIIDDILDLSKIEAGKLLLDSQSFELNSIIENIENLLVLKVQEKKLLFKVDVDPQVPKVLKGDPARLRQVLLNLVGNAVKFTEKGSVSLSCSLENLQEENRRLCIVVNDTGIGIPKATQEQLFQPFSQGDASVTRRYGGTGLGLNICKRLVHAMGGEIGVESKEGRGSSFWIKIPIEQGDINDLPVIADSKPILTSSLAILLVEDDETNQEVALAMLEQMGCKTTLTVDGYQAVEAIKKQDFDLVFMDIQMPEMDGYQATGMIRNNPRYENLPVIAMTAHTMTGEREKCLSAGMNEHVAKPIDP